MLKNGPKHRNWLTNETQLYILKWQEKHKDRRREVKHVTQG